VCTPLLSSIRVICPNHVILLDLITRTILGEEHRSLSSSLCSFLHSPVISSLVGPYVLNILFSNNNSLRSSLNVSDQVSHTYKTPGKTIVLSRTCVDKNKTLSGLTTRKTPSLERNSYCRKCTERQHSRPNNNMHVIWSLLCQAEVRDNYCNCQPFRLKHVFFTSLCGTHFWSERDVDGFRLYYLAKNEELSSQKQIPTVV